MSDILRLGPFSFDPVGASLHGPTGPVALRRKTFEVLRSSPTSQQVVPRTSSRSRLADVSLRGLLSQCIKISPRAWRSVEVIKTVPRRGYMPVFCNPDDRVRLGEAPAVTCPLPSLSALPNLAVRPGCYSPTALLKNHH